MKKKVLLVSKQLSYPLFKGGSIAQYYFIDGLKNEVEFILCTQISSKEQLKQIEVLQAKRPDLKIYYYLKQQDKIKTILRKILNLFTKQRFVSNDFDVIKGADNLQDEKFIELINNIIRQENIKQVQFDFYETIDLSYAIPQNIKKIFIHHELKFKRLQLGYNNSNHSDSYKSFVINKTEAVEKTFLKNTDIAAVFNENDADIIKDSCNQLIVSSFGIPDELIYKDRISKTFSRFLFVGGENHPPNSLGLSWFLDTVYIPNIDSISYPLWIIGNWTKAYQTKYKKYSKIVFCGVVDSVEPYFNETVFVNPILTGSGIRTKVLHAFVNRVPVISTRFGAEGCYTQSQQNHLIFFDSSEEFYNNMNQITSEKWTELAQAGFNYYNEHFDKTTLLAQRLKMYI